MTGPGDSARKICIERSLDFGRIAKTKTKIPIPPIQWVKLRHNNIHFGKDSTSFKILDPVVVKPETVSKKASIKCGIVPENQNGRAPTIDNTTQHKPTAIRPSRAKYMRCFTLMRDKGKPTTRQAIITKRKERTSS